MVGLRKKDFYKRNKSLILISVIFILFIVVGSCINKIDSSNLEDMSSQIGEIKSYYNGNISIKDFTITKKNIENIRLIEEYLSLSYEFSRLFNLWKLLRILNHNIFDCRIDVDIFINNIIIIVHSVNHVYTVIKLRKCF